MGLKKVIYLIIVMRIYDVLLIKESIIHLALRLRGGGGFQSFCMDMKNLDVKYNYDFTDLKDDGTCFERGGRRYLRPYGWRRVALNVKTR